MSTSECPQQAQWQLFLAEQATAVDRADMASHLDHCERCITTVEAFSDEWSVSQFIPVTQAKLDQQAHALLASLKLQGPLSLEHQPPIPLASRDAPPEIPGLTNLMPVHQGGIGLVYQAWETDLGRAVALKMLSSLSFISPDVRARAEREAKTLAGLKHPNIVEIHRAGEIDGVPYIVMEWVTGGTLQARIEQTTLAPREAASIVRDLAEALVEAHAVGIVHRDLKPDNILLQPYNGSREGFTPKLADFGLAFAESDPGLTKVGMILGTPSYMAPEQTGRAQPQAKVGPATDIHGLGATLYALLTGRPPYDGSTSWESLLLASTGQYQPVQALCRHVPRDLRTIVDKCLKLAPQQRYQSARDLAADLDRFLNGRPIKARSVATHERLLKWARRQPALAALLLCLGAAAVATSIGVAYHLRSMSQALTRAQLAVEKQQQLLATFHHQVVQRLLLRGTALNPEDLTFLNQIREQYLAWPLDPQPIEALRYRAAGLRQLGDVYFKLEHYQDAHDCRMQAAAAMEQALGLDPTNLDLKRVRAQALLESQRALIRTDQFATKETVNESLLTELEELAALDPRQRVNLASGLITMAARFAELGQHEKALKLIPRALEQADLYLADAGNDPVAWRNVAMMYYSAAYCLRKVGDPDQSEDFLNKTLSLGKAGEGRFPNSQFELIRVQRVALSALAELIIAREGWDQARATLDQLVQVCRHGISLKPDEKLLIEFQDGLIVEAILRSQINMAQDQPAASVTELEQAIVLARNACEQEPAVFDRSQTLIIALLQLADVSRASHQPDQATSLFQDVFRIAQPWLAHADRKAEVQDFMNSAGNGLIRLAVDAGDHAQAAALLRQQLQTSNERTRPALEERLLIQEAAAQAISPSL